MTARREIAEYLVERGFGDEEMSDDDLAVLLFIATYSQQHDRLPRFREIAEARGLTHAGARSAVRRLRAVGQLSCYDRPYLVVC